jgi:hypothetical protein
LSIWVDRVVEDKIQHTHVHTRTLRLSPAAVRGQGVNWSVSTRWGVF